MLAAVAGVAGVLGLAVAPQASAAPVVTALDCESGAVTLHCWLSYTNVVGPLTIRWYVNGAHWAASDNSDYLRRGCVFGQAQQVLVVLTDSTGTTQHLGGTVCRREWQ